MLVPTPEKWRTQAAELGHEVLNQSCCIPNKSEPRLTFPPTLPGLLQRGGERSSAGSLCYSSRLHAAGAAVSEGRRRHQGERYAYIAGVAKIKVVNNVGLQKLLSNLSRAPLRARPRPAAATRSVVSAGQPGDVTEGRREKKNHSPQMCPSRHRRNNMSAKDGHVLLVMSTRGGGKVDTMVALSASSPPQPQPIKVQTYTTGGENVQLATWRTHCLGAQV